MKSKRCSKCKQEKPVTAFAKNRTRRDGHCEWCRSCTSEYKKKTDWHRKYRDRNRETFRRRSRFIQKTEKGKARQAIRSRVYAGQIHKPLRCQVCYSPTPRQLLHGHHPDYRNKLLVLWLCHSCHTLVDCGLLSIDEYLPHQGELLLE